MASCVYIASQRHERAARPAGKMSNRSRHPFHRQRKALMCSESIWRAYEKEGRFISISYGRIGTSRAWQCVFGESS